MSTIVDNDNDNSQQNGEATTRGSNDDATNIDSDDNDGHDATTQACVARGATTMKKASTAMTTGDDPWTRADRQTYKYDYERPCENREKPKATSHEITCSS
jgi:hypothetical protein